MTREPPGEDPELLAIEALSRVEGRRGAAGAHRRTRRSTILIGLAVGALMLVAAASLWIALSP